jgi:chorismate-pyruvate lyase
MSAIDILAELDGCSPTQVGPLQRVLLITDGTLTEILEATFLERIRLVKVAQRLVPATSSHSQLEPGEEDLVMERKILLRGTDSGRNYAYAESLVAIDRLSSPLRDALLISQTPLGRLWREHRLETFKELVDVHCRPASSLAHYFDCKDTSPLLARTYRVYSARRPVMVISEYFPAGLQPEDRIIDEPAFVLATSEEWSD